MKKIESARVIERARKLMKEREDAFSEELDNALCAAVNKTAAKFRRRLVPGQINKLIVRVLSDQLYYSIHEERRF